MRVVFAGGGTGGHLYPGIAIARALVKADPRIRPFFVGARRGIERDVLPTSGFPFELLDLHPLYRRAVWNNWWTITGAVSAWRRLTAMTRAERPALVIGTGGYAAGVAMAHAVAQGVPIVQQAGDSVPGLTARAFSRYSREIYLNFPEAARHLRAHNPGSLIDTGAPIEPPPTVRPDRGSVRAAWGFPPAGGVVVLAFGGSQGALAINRAVASWVTAGLPANIHLIWATGRSTFEEFRRHESDRVRVRAFLSPMAEAYAATDLAVARAGATGTAELAAWGIPAVLIPLPTAAADHQTTNARTLAAAGAAIHLPQSSLTPTSLAEVVSRLIAAPGELDRLHAGALARARPDAAAEIATRIISLLATV